MSDSESEGDAPLSVLDEINALEQRVQHLKSQVISAGNNEALAASSLLEEHAGISNCLERMAESVETRAFYIINGLLLYLIGDGNELLDRDESYWCQFHDKLKALGEASMEFRKLCLFRERSRDGCTIFHEICKLSPPLDVVKTLMDIIPIATFSDERKKLYPGVETSSEPDDRLKITQYNHHSCTESEHGSEYPLHMVVRHGGTFELVEFLVEADTTNETLKINKKNNSVYHVLAENRGSHNAEVFSKTLRYLVMKIKSGASPLLYPNEEGKVPILSLGKSLGTEGLYRIDIIYHHDFAFLLKTMCYHYEQRDNKHEKMDISDDECEGMVAGESTMKEIEGISHSRAFLVCSTLFPKKAACESLDELLSRDNNFLFDKDSCGRYPIHRMVQNRSFLLNTLKRNFYESENLYMSIIEAALKNTPECARQVNNEGLLPLHIAADLKRVDRENLSDSAHLELVQIIWRTY